MSRERANNRRGASGEIPAPVRVLIVAPSFDILGGQSVQAARLIQGLRREPSLEVSFLPVNPRLPGPFRWLQRIKYVRTVVTSLLYLATLLARVRKYDVIHIFSASYLSFVIAPTPAILVARLYGKKILLNYHSGQAEDHLRRWRRSAIPVMRMADAIVVQSDYLVEVFARFGLRAEAVFNHIDTSAFIFRERKPLKPLFLSNRNFEPHYGVATVLRAFALIQQRLPEARLTVAGEGAERAELERLSHELGLRHTQFTGKVAPERMPELYDAAAIFLNGSEVDNMPLSILESFASGLAVVTTNAGGIPYIVKNEKTGLLVNVQDHEAMAACALRLLDDDALAQKLTAAAREECLRYEWRAVKDKWLKVYFRLSSTDVEALESEPLVDSATVSER